LRSPSSKGRREDRGEERVRKVRVGEGKGGEGIGRKEREEDGREGDF